MTTLWKRFGAMAGAAIAAADRTRIRLRDHGVYRTPGNGNALQFPFSDAVHVLFPYKVLDSAVTTGSMFRLRNEESLYEHPKTAYH